MAYAAKYYIEFSSIIDEQYRMEILQDGYTGDVTELTAGPDPLSITYNQNDFLYNPLRFAGASMQVVIESYLPDLYSNNYHSNKINIYRDDNLIFTGYLTPEIYQQENSGYLKDIELSAVSALSTLEYSKFETELTQISIHQLIADALAASGGDYGYVYIPKVWNSANTMKTFVVSASNFIDEEGEPMTYKDILEQIALFYNLTITEKDGNIYFIDVDYVKRGQTDYYRYDVTMSNETAVTLTAETQNISDADSRGDNNSLSIINSYSKITILASDYEVEKERLFLPFEFSPGKGYLTFTEYLTYEGTTYMKKYCTSANYELIQYQESGTTFVPVATGFNPTDNAGASLVNLTSFDITELPNKHSWESMLQVKLYDGHSPTEDTMTMTEPEDVNAGFFPVLRYSMKDNIVFSKDQVLAINFQLFYLTSNDDLMPMVERSQPNDIVNQGQLSWYYVPMMLRVGGKYYTGSNGVWSDEETNFQAGLDLKAGDHFSNRWLNCFDDNNLPDYLPELSGKLVRFADDMIGDLELTIYCPRQHPYSSTGNMHYYHRATFIKNLEINSQVSGIASAGDQKQDTTYTNIISDEYLNEVDDIELKITSKNDSELSRSKILDTSTSEVLDTVTSYYSGDGEAYKPEHLIIDKITNQYQQVKIKIDEETRKDLNPYQLINILSQPGRDFIMTAETIDCRKNSSVATMIEIV